MRKTLSFSCVLVLCNSLYAQTVRTPSSMRYTGIGTYSRHFVDAFAITGNQASLCNLKTVQAGLYTENRFSLQELNLVSGVIGLPLKNSGIGITVNRFGSGDYKEMQAGLAYGKKLGDKVDIGVQFNYNTINITGYDGASTLNIEVGSIWHFTEKLHGGIHLYNPSGSKYGKTVFQKIPAIYKMGFGYENGNRFLVSMEIAKEEGQPVNVNTGVHYAFHENFFMRFGIATGANNSFAGVGLKWKVCRLDLSFSYHPQLGFTRGLSLLFLFRQQPAKEEE
ncbi:MAG TPA: hypothetical protein VJ647_05380 [Chitinophagaceae bacterium]|nr:hypothetical protein [Chitinophagaceae bacterium]